MNTEHEPVDSDPTAETTEQVAAEPTPEPRQASRLRPRTGPIVWGVLVLSFCGYVTIRTIGGNIDVISWAITTVFVLGVLLLGVGIAVLIRSSRDRP